MLGKNQRQPCVKTKTKKADLQRRDAVNLTCNERFFLFRDENRATKLQSHLPKPLFVDSARFPFLSRLCFFLSPSFFFPSLFLVVCLVACVSSRADNNKAKMRNRSCTALLLFVVACALCTSVTTAEKCDVRCWLGQLRVFIPSLGPMKIGLSNLWLTNMTVKDIELHGITSEYPSKHNNPDNIQTTFYVGITNAAIKIHSWWGWEEGSDDHEVDMNASGVDFSLGLLFSTGSDGLIEEVSVNYMDMAIDDLKVDFHNKFVNAFSGIVNIVKNLVIAGIKGKVQETLDDLFKNNVTEMFHMANGYIREYLNNTEALDLPVNTTDMVDIRTSTIVDAVRFLFDDFIGVNGPVNLSYIVNLFANEEKQIRLTQFYNESIEFTIPISDLDANITLGIKDVVLSDLDTWRHFELMTPKSEVMLVCKTDLEHLGINVSWYVNVSIGNNGTFEGEVESLYEEAEIGTYLDDNVMDLILQLASWSGVATNYSSAQCLNTSCMEALVSGDSTGLTFFQLNFTFRYIELLANTGDLEADVRDVFNNLVSLFVDNYKPFIAPALNGFVRGEGLVLLNGLLSDALVDTFCPDLPDNVTAEVNPGATAGSVAGAGVLTALLVLLPCGDRIKKKRKSKKDEKETDGVELENQTPTETTPMECDEEGATYACVFKAPKWIREFTRTDPEGASLFLDQRLNFWFRMVMPFLLLLTIGIFISSNTGVGASVFVYLTLGTQKTIILPSLFDFGLINTVIEMWTAKVYPLAVLILLMSGVWPYAKVVLMIVCFFMPKSLMPGKIRNRMMVVLDMLGKWSLLDTYVMLMMLVALHFHIVFPVKGEDVEGPMMIDLYVYPAYGFLTLALGTLVSLIMSHLVLGAHRILERGATDNTVETAVEKKPLMSFVPGFLGKTVPRFFVLGFLVVTLALSIAGSVLMTFSFNFEGLAGWALPLLDVSAHREYSVLDLGVQLPQSAQNPNSFTVRFTQVVHLLTAFVAPILHIVAMILLWVVPLKRTVQYYWFRVCDVLYAWSCADVFIISIIAAVLQIQQFAGFMVGDKCDFIQPYIEEYFGELLGDYPTSCFEVIARLESGCYLLFVAVILHTILTLLFTKSADKALNVRAGYKDGIIPPKDKSTPTETPKSDDSADEKASQDKGSTPEPQYAPTELVPTTSPCPYPVPPSSSSSSSSSGPSDGVSSSVVSSASSVEDLPAPENMAPAPPCEEPTASATE